MLKYGADVHHRNKENKNALLLTIKSINLTGIAEELIKYGADINLEEEDGTTKIPRYHYIYVIIFSDNSFDNLIKFVKFIKNYKKSCYIECVYDNDIYKLLYASSYYLNNSNKELSKKYKNFIENKIFTPNECKLLQVLI
jgi:hypothetical protein